VGRVSYTVNGGSQRGERERKAGSGIGPLCLQSIRSADGLSSQPPCHQQPLHRQPLLMGTRIEKGDDK